MNYKDNVLDGIRIKWKENGQWEKEAVFKEGEWLSGWGNQLTW